MRANCSYSGRARVLVQRRRAPARRGRRRSGRPRRRLRESVARSARDSRASAARAVRAELRVVLPALQQRRFDRRRRRRRAPCPRARGRASRAGALRDRRSSPRARRPAPAAAPRRRTRRSPPAGARTASSRTRACDSASSRALEPRRGLDRGIEEALIDADDGRRRCLSAAANSGWPPGMKGGGSARRTGTAPGLRRAIAGWRSASMLREPQVGLRLLQLQLRGTAGRRRRAACCSAASCSGARTRPAPAARRALRAPSAHSRSRRPRNRRDRHLHGRNAPRKNAGRSRSPALVDEPLEAGLIHPEHRHEHRPGRERKDAQRHQIDDELIGRDRPHRAGPTRASICRRSASSDPRADGPRASCR